MTKLKQEGMRAITPEFKKAYKLYRDFKKKDFDKQRPLKDANREEIVRELKILGVGTGADLMRWFAEGEFVLPLKPEDEIAFGKACKSYRNKAYRLLKDPQNRIDSQLYEDFCGLVKRSDEFPDIDSYYAYLDTVPLFSASITYRRLYIACWRELQARLMVDAFFALGEDRQKAIFSILSDSLQARTAWLREHQNVKLPEFAPDVEEDFNNHFAERLKFAEPVSEAMTYATLQMKFECFDFDNPHYETELLKVILGRKPSLDWLDDDFSALAEYADYKG